MTTATDQRGAVEELLGLLRRLRRELPLRDALAIFFPPALGYELLQGRRRAAALPSGDYDPELPDADLLEPSLALGRWLGQHYFRVAVHGGERVPATGPALLVGNHSAGLMPVDALFAIDDIRARHGAGRVVHPLVHDFAYQAPRLGRHARRFGVLRASRENAAAAFADDRIVLVYPGGDKDAFRPYGERNRIVLAGRKGFVRLALAHRVPVIPLVSVGLHESLVVLTRGERIAQKLELKRLLRTEVAPLALMFPWGLAPAAVPFLPLPTDIEMRFGEPIRLEGEADDEAALDAGYRRVEAAMQAILDDLSDGRVPLVGRPPAERP